uniref:Ovule protein n=1 Tax=Acrobeloides nanus TaxID=290746 RepID=A0A914ELU2_9BILA
MIITIKCISIHAHQTLMKNSKWLRFMMEKEFTKYPVPNIIIISIITTIHMKEKKFKALIFVLEDLYKNLKL